MSNFSSPINLVDAAYLDLTNYSDDHQIWITGGQTTPDNLRKLQKEMFERWNQGRFSIEEASAHISKYANEDFYLIQNKLVNAVKNKTLNSYAPTQSIIREAKDVCENYDELYWDDINKWLNDYEKRISWRFDKPNLDSNEIQEMRSSSVHTLRNRINILDAEINLAKDMALDKSDPSSVWSELIKMAGKQDINQKGCLIGLDENYIKYFNGDEVKFFSKKNLSDRMARKLTR